MMDLVKVRHVCASCFAVIDADGVTVYDYDTPVLRISWDGTPHRLWDGWSQTTARHVGQAMRAFGYDSGEWPAYSKMPVRDVDYIKKWEGR